MTLEVQIAITLLSVVLVESLAVVTFAHQTFCGAYKRSEEARTHFVSQADNLVRTHGTNWVVRLTEKLYQRRIWLAVETHLCRWISIAGLIAVAFMGLWIYVAARSNAPIIIEVYLLPYTTYVLLVLSVLLVILLALAMLEREKTQVPEATFNQLETPPEEG